MRALADLIVAREQGAIDQGKGKMAGSASRTIYGDEAVPASAVAQVLRRTPKHEQDDAGEGRQSIDHGVAALPHDRVIPVAAFVDDVKRKVALRKVMFDMKNPGTQKQAEALVSDDTLQPGQQWDKDATQVNYRYSGNVAKSCGVCTYFIAPGECEIVAGLIRPVDVCDQFEPLEAIMQRAQIRPSTLVTPEYLGEVAAVILARQLREQDDDGYDDEQDSQCSDDERDLQGYCPDDSEFDYTTAGLFDQDESSEGGPGSGPQSGSGSEHEELISGHGFIPSAGSENFKEYVHPNGRRLVVYPKTGMFKVATATGVAITRGSIAQLSGVLVDEFGPAKQSEGGPGSGPQGGGGGSTPEAKWKNAVKSAKKAERVSGIGSAPAEQAWKVADMEKSKMQAESKNSEGTMQRARADEGGPGSGPQGGGGKAGGGKKGGGFKPRAPRKPNPGSLAGGGGPPPLTGGRYVHGDDNRFVWKKSSERSKTSEGTMQRARADEGGPGSGPQGGGGGGSRPQSGSHEDIKDNGWQISKSGGRGKADIYSKDARPGEKLYVKAVPGTKSGRAAQRNWSHVDSTGKVFDSGSSGDSLGLHLRSVKSSESLVTVDLSSRLLESMIRAAAARLVGGG